MANRSNPTSDADLGRRLLLSGAAAAGALAAAHRASAQPDAAAYVTLERAERGAVLLIGINRPQVQNRIEVPTFLALGRAYWQLDHDEALRAAVLFAHGDDFSPGLDPSSWAEAMRAGLFRNAIPEFVNPVGTSRPYRLKPVVVAAHGRTQLLGHELFLAADIRVAASDTQFAQAEVARGVFPGAGGAVRFAREAGWANAMRYMLTGDTWGPEEARRLGLVQEVTQPGRELDRAIEIARKIAANAPLGVRAVLASVHQALASEDEALAATFPVFAGLMQSEDRQEFARALEEKRAPVYRGR
jgi:enoyl-CoA hydratase/carnithine racemase